MRGGAAAALAARTNSASSSDSESRDAHSTTRLPPPSLRRLKVNGVDRFSCIIVGGGTAGCTTAYLVSKWMKDFNVPGHVLLIDRGVGFNPKEGPSSKMDVWYENWCAYGEAHEAVDAADGRAYPVVPTDHRGLGGCSTHDTRITFQMRQDQKERVALEMGWTVTQLDEYFQAALNLMPLAPAIPHDAPVPFYTAVMESLTSPGALNGSPLSRLDDDEHKSGVVVDSVAMSSLAMYTLEDGREVRWTPTYLLLDEVRPSNLHIVTNALVDRLKFNDTLTAAEGVVVQVGDETFMASPESDGGGTIALTLGALGTAALLQRSGCGPGDHLDSLGIPVVINNPSIGHGIDHEEIAIVHEWLDRWNTAEGDVPKGGAHGWPLVLYSSFLPELARIYGDGAHLSGYYQAHFGAGYAEPYTESPSVVATPNCLRPLHTEQGGYRLFIQSTDPSTSFLLKQGNHRKDLETIALGAFSVSKIFNQLHRDGIVGKQLEPPFAISEENKERLVAWIKENHYTVFHWACTCQAGRHGRVADERFRLRTRREVGEVISNLFLGSAAALPEVSENNPHLTISAFSVALAEELTRSLAQTHGRDYGRMRLLETTRAAHEVKAAAGVTIRRAGEERPAMISLARDYIDSWERENALPRR